MRCSVSHGATLALLLREAGNRLAVHRPSVDRQKLIPGSLHAFSFGGDDLVQG